MKNFIQKCILYIARLSMSFIYFFIKLFPMQKNKILMLSRQSNTPSIDFNLLNQEIKNRNNNINVKILCKKIPENFIGKIAYCFYIVKCMYNLATSKICIVDGYVIPVSALKHKKGLVIMQIWHAMGAIKQFGYQITDKKEGSNNSVAKIMKMHKNYTNITCTSEATKKIYAQAFNINESKILKLGMPRIDYLLNENINKNIEEIYKEYPKLKEKQNILYVPTFRKNVEIDLTQICNSFNKEKYNLIIRLHPLDKSKVDEGFLINNKYSTLDLIKIADYIITDYSAASFEAATINKKIFFYLYDIKEYEKARGLNINLKQEMPNETFNEIKEIAKRIENNLYNEEELENFRKKYIETIDTKNTERIVNYLLQYIK